MDLQSIYYIRIRPTRLLPTYFIPKLVYDSKYYSMASHILTVTAVQFIDNELMPTLCTADLCILSRSCPATLFQPHRNHPQSTKLFMHALSMPQQPMSE